MDWLGKVEMRLYQYPETQYIFTFRVRLSDDYISFSLIRAVS